MAQNNELVTKTDLENGLAVTKQELREEIRETKKELRVEIQETKKELRAEIKETEQRLQNEIHELRIEMADTKQSLREGIAENRKSILELNEKMDRLLVGVDTLVGKYENQKQEIRIQDHRHEQLDRSIQKEEIRNNGQDVMLEDHEQRIKAIEN